MKIYSSEIADMKVSLFANGTDNLLTKLNYDFIPDDDYSDSDVLLILSKKPDKAVTALLDGLDLSGSIATLVLGVFCEKPEKEWFVLDSYTVCAESLQAYAAADLLSLIDYYIHVKPIDIGRELADRGALSYKRFGAMPNGLSDVTADKIPADASRALLFLSVGTEVWISDIDALMNELDETTGSKDISLAAVRNESENTVNCSIFISE